MKAAPAISLEPPTALAVSRGFDLGALIALFVLTVRQHLHGRRLLVLSILFLVPSVLALLTQLNPRPPDAEHLEFAFIFNLIPHALATLTALLYAAGMIQDEVEEQTLTYLLLRPLPRWALYIVKFMATVLVTTVLTAIFTTLTFAVIYWQAPELWDEVLPDRAFKTAGVLALAQLGYCAFFGALGLWTRRALFVGLAYIIVFEGLLANFDTVARMLTVMYYFRVLSLRWLDPPDGASWGLHLDLVPSATQCVLTLVVGSVVLVILGAVMMMRREFRMKTPEGS
jgi:ABC-2 type transport system permease protein